ncbi:MAG: 3'(2'),5'-bisphosphate nucleotidase CysQ [Flavobacteriaceae bacterium]
MNSNLEIAIKAAIEAGREILTVYETNFSVTVKDDFSPLTLADQMANKVIQSFLKETPFPIISEENKLIAYAQRKKWSKCWIVDPLDGTKEFIKRNGEFTVNIALIENGKPIMGVIYVPVSKTLYYSIEGLSKAYKVVLSEDESVPFIVENSSEIKPSKLQEPIKIVGSRSHLNEETQSYISAIERQSKVEIVSKGSSLKFCLIAEGSAHIYPRFAPTMEWDTAAGQAICEAVGVSVINQDTQKPLQYNKEDLRNPFFLVRVV